MVLNKLVLVLCAMEEEAQPFFDRAPAVAELGTFGKASFYSVNDTGDSPRFLIAITGIGGANAAAATAIAIERFSPRAVIYAGTTGGLGQGVHVRDVVVGSAYRYSSADATVFGYAPGQIPQMPEYYSGNKRLLSRADNCSIAKHPGYAHSVIRIGEVLSADSFITADNAADVRNTFPDALATDMESAFAAQVCHVCDVPFVSVRGVSDLCSPNGAEEFHVNTDVAATASTLAVLELMKN